MILYVEGYDKVRLLTRKPVGKALREKLTSEVFPSLRETGQYRLPARATLVPIGDMQGYAAHLEQGLAVLDPYLKFPTLIYSTFAATKRLEK
jgi:hypothetical protein